MVNPNQNSRKKIEATLDVCLPGMYQELLSDGMLDWDEQGPNWYENVYPNLRAKPPFLVFANDFRLIPPEKVVEYAEALKLAASEFHAVVPIGRNGAGDLFCLLFNSATSVDSVCKVNRRTGASVRLARDLSDFVFRELLGTVAQINEEDLESEEDYLKDILAMLQSHKKYISEARFRILEKVYSKPIQQQDDDEMGMISLDEFSRILEDEISFEGLNQRFALPLQG